ncbi:MAG: DNA polymerase [Oscillospiraceae bacterium]|nr:DNA polymerase [Oscillospiraceae bacterium]
MRTLSVDIETYSPTSLKDCGVYIYAGDRDFEVLLLAYAFDDAPVQVVDYAQGQTLPDEVLAALVDPAVTKTAFNAQFERVCLAAWLGMAMPPEQWQCTQMLAAELGLPDSLGTVGTAMKLPQDAQKDKAGDQLIKYFCQPCAPTKVNGKRERNLPVHAPDRWADFVEYCRQDVVAERAIRNSLLAYEIPESEYRLWELDQRINDRGVMVDIEFAANANHFDDMAKEHSAERFAELTDGANPNSAAQIKRWIESTCGVAIDSLRKELIDEVSAACNDPRVDEMLALRGELTKTSTKKYGAMLRWTGDDRRARGTFKFHGASTGRWTGKGIQLQNLKRNLMPDTDLDIARQLVRDGDYEVFGLLYPQTDTLSQLLRTALIPRPGTRFIVADFNSIEARVLAWFAGEQWRMDEFNGEGLIYERSAERLFGLPHGSVTKSSPERARGKVAELALGYGMGAPKFRTQARQQYRYHLTENEASDIVNRWRAGSPAIMKLWRSMEPAAKRAIVEKKHGHLTQGAFYYKDGPLLRLHMPSGRSLSYVRPSIKGGSIHFQTKLGKNWVTNGTWYGTLVENLVQAAARDCLAAALLALHAEGYEIVAHVHDEVVIEAPASVTVDEVCEVMAQPLPWANGLPLRAAGFEADYYRKD